MPDNQVQDISKETLISLNKLIDLLEFIEKPMKDKDTS